MQPPKVAAVLASHFSRDELRSPTWAQATPGASGEEGHPSIGGPDPAAAPDSKATVTCVRTALLGALGALALFVPVIVTDSVGGTVGDRLVL